MGKMAMAAAAAGLTLAVAGAAQAQAQMTLECQVRASRPDHGVTRWKRRIIINPSTRTVRILDDFGAGSGYTPRSTFAFMSMTPQRIMLEQGGGKVSYIDRTTGEYVLRNERARFTLRGRCSGAR